jgi:hypothetical protein
MNLTIVIPSLYVINSLLWVYKWWVHAKIFEAFYYQSQRGAPIITKKEFDRMSSLIIENWVNEIRRLFRKS